MQSITKIQQQKKARHRYNIFLNDEYAFSVDEDILVKYHLRKGLELAKDEVKEIKDHENVHHHYAQAINYLSYRMRTKQEIRTYLRDKEVTPDVIEEIMGRLENEQLLDDLAFAEAFVRDRMNQTSKGPRVIVNELRQKGVDAETSKQAVLQYDEESQFTKAFKWAQREANKKSQHALNKRKEQIRQKLTQRGFASGVVSGVMNEIEIEVDEDEEYARLEKQANTLLRRYEKRHEGFELKMKLKAALYNRRFSGTLIDQYLDNLDESR